MIFALAMAVSCKSVTNSGSASVPPSAQPSAASASPSGTDVSAAPTSTATMSTSSSSPAEPSAEPSADKNTIKLEGSIGDIPIHMSMTIEDGIVTGTYYYDRVGQDIRIEGTIEANRMMTMKEFETDGPVTGAFDGWYTPGIDFTGIWTNAKTNKTLNFSLNVINGIPKDAVWSGAWNRLHAGLYDTAKIAIFNETKTGFDFQIDAFSGANMGFVGGYAVIDGASAHFQDKDTSAELLFSLKDGLIDVKSSGDISYYAGAGVGFDGKYTKDQLPEFTLLTEGYVSSKAQEDAFKAMVGADYELFLNTANIVADEQDLDGFGAQVYRWWVRGIALSNASIVMFLPDGNFCAGVIDPENNIIKVYTNAADITAVPKTILAWADGFSKMPVEFHNSSEN